MNKIIDMGNKPYSQINVEMEMLLNPFWKPKISPLSHLSMIGSYKRVYGQMARLQAKAEICRAGLALKIYKSKYQKYPNSMRFLCPEILNKVPNDPFTGNNLTYRKSKDGFILYSLGHNMKDDGGIPRFLGRAAKTDAQRKARKDYDIVWKCEK